MFSPGLVLSPVLLRTQTWGQHLNTEVQEGDLLSWVVVLPWSWGTSSRLTPSPSSPWPPRFSSDPKCVGAEPWETEI